MVERNQRERLIAALPEVCAEQGYASVTVVDVARRAGVSTASFYKQFADKRECMLTSFEELFERLFREIEQAFEHDANPSAKVRAAIDVAAALLAADLPSARLLTVEIIAAGEEGARLQHAAIERLAERLQTEWATVAALVAVVARRVTNGEGPMSAELEEVCGTLS